MYSKPISVQHSVAIQWLNCVWLCNPMNCSTPGLPVLHYLLEFVQTHVHWVNDAISSSVTPFSFCSQSFPASGSFPVIWLFAWGDQSIGVSASASVLPVNIQGWFPLGLTSLSSLLSKGPSRVFFNSTVQKHQFFRAHFSLYSNSHSHMWLSIALTLHSFVSKVMSLLFNTLSKFVIGFFPRNICLLLLTIHIDFGAQENNIEHGDYS